MTASALLVFLNLLSLFRRERLATIQDERISNQKDSLFVQLHEISMWNCGKDLNVLYNDDNASIRAPATARRA